MIFEWWTVAATANVFMVLIYATIAIIMVRGIHDGHQWRSNPVAVATAAVFVSCTIGHGLHLVHVLPPFSTLEPLEAAAARAMFSDPRLIAWDVVTGAMAIGYFFLRKRLAIVYQGASLNEDFLERQNQANLIQSRVIASLDEAQRLFDAGREDEGMRHIELALEEGKDVISTLLAPTRGRGKLNPGDLRRDAASH